jgi:hypothetical protein
MGLFRPPPPIFIGGAQPYERRKLRPLGVSVLPDNPPFVGGSRIPRAVLLAWQQLPVGPMPSTAHPSTPPTGPPPPIIPGTVIESGGGPRIIWV